MNTLSNVNLQEEFPGDWFCTPLHQLELTAKATYYIVRTLEQFGALIP